MELFNSIVSNTHICGNSFYNANNVRDTLIEKPLFDPNNSDVNCTDNYKPVLF
jgi:hypothetical protein